MEDCIKQLVENTIPYVLEWKRYFHMHPEVAFKEYDTTEKICSLLESFGNIEVIRPCPTGAVGILQGDKPGKTIAFRADIDALPVKEQVKSEYISKTDGVMHACGHDANMAMLLGAAKILSEMKDQIHGEIRFIFQPAEEVPHGGARKMVEAGALDGVDVIFGAHADTLTKCGAILLKHGAMMASSYTFHLTVYGRGGHAAFPDQNIDCISAASEIISSFNRVVSREVRALDSVVVTPTQIHAGNSLNVMPDEVTICGTIRILQGECEDRVLGRLQDVAESIAAMYGGSCSFNVDKSYSALSNDKILYDAAKIIMTKAFGHDMVLEDSAVMGAEDFSEYLAVTRGFYYKIGGRRLTGDPIGPHHSSTFELNDDMLSNGVEACVRMLSEFPQELL